MNFRLALTLGWETLRSRLALTVLSVLLLSLGSALMSGLWGTVYLLHGLQREFLSALSVELELVSDSEPARTAVTSRAEAWPSVEFVEYVSPDQTLRDEQQETGEDLLSLFGSNPFPAIIRVRFGRITLATVDSLTSAAQKWPEVAQVVYPRRLWSDADHFIARFHSGLGTAAIVFIVAVIGLVGLCTRAQVRNRSAVWEFLRLSGAAESTLRLSTLVLGAITGMLSGIIACGILYGLAAIGGWLLFRDIVLPLGFYGIAWITAVILGIIAATFSVRKM